MSTETTTQPTGIATAVGHWVTLIEAHERIILTSIAALVLWHYGDKAYDALIRFHENQASQTQQQLQQTQVSGADIEQKLNVLLTQQAAQKKIEDAKTAIAKARLQKQQQVDASLPMPELAARWQELLVLPAASVTSQPNGTVVVTDDAAHSTVNELEKVAPLTEQLVSTQTELASCNAVQTKQATDITNLHQQVADSDKLRAQDAQIAKEKQHKAWMNGFKWGAIAGFVGGILTLHKI
jgi:hypothetical protein